MTPKNLLDKLLRDFLSLNITRKSNFVIFAWNLCHYLNVKRIYRTEIWRINIRKPVRSTFLYSLNNLIFVTRM